MCDDYIFKIWGDSLFIPQFILLVNEIIDYEFRKKNPKQKRGILLKATLPWIALHLSSIH